MISTLFVLIILILDIVASVDVLTGSGWTGHKVPCTLLNLFLPLIGRTAKGA
jgi:hypothetical protein